MFHILAADTTTTDNGLFDGVNDFFNSDTWLVTRNLGIFFVVVFWLASAYWVFKDARRRIEDPWLIAMATLLGLVPPFIGPLVYLFFRPPEYLEDRRERELEIRAMEEQLGHRYSHCPVCHAVGRGGLPRLSGLHDQAEAGMHRCKAPLEPLWQVCPYCETPVVRRPPVYDETMAGPPAILDEPLRTPRRRRSGVEGDTAENLRADQ